MAWAASASRCLLLSWPMTGYQTQSNSSRSAFLLYNRICPTHIEGYFSERFSWGESMLFISYRKADTQAVVDNLAKELKKHFGEGCVFKDDQDLRAGDRWTQ